MNRFARFTALAAAALLTAGSAFAGTQTERVQANDSEFFTWTADRDGEVIVSIDGDGDTDLDLYAFDARGNLLDSDISLDDDEIVAFYAEAGRTYEIEVRNLGGVWNQFDLELEYVSHFDVDTVQAGGEVSYTYTASNRGNGDLVITLHGDRNVDIDIHVYDSRGNRVAQAISFDEHERLYMVTQPNADYEIVVVNYGNVSTDFVLVLTD